MCERDGACKALLLLNLATCVALAKVDATIAK